MKTIVNSHLPGKWYQIARTTNACEKEFVEVFVYLSTTYNDNYDILYVGVNADRSKYVKKFDFKVESEKESLSFVVKKLFFRKKFKILFFDDKDAVIIIADRKMKYISIYSKNCKVKKSAMESYLSKLDFLKNYYKKINFYSNNIID